MLTLDERAAVLGALAREIETLSDGAIMPDPTARYAIGRATTSERRYEAQLLIAAREKLAHGDPA